MIRVRWKDFELPRQVLCDEKTLTATYGCFKAEPFEHGFGMTIGNGLRRVLLSSIEGSAVTAVKIHGVSHEFDTMEGVLEDVTDIILNIKNLIVRLNSDEPQKLTLKVKKQGAVTAADITPVHTVEILNPELHIATLVDDREFSLELSVKKGRGYVPAEEHAPVEREIGEIFMDAIFSPVRRVNYRVEKTRVGRLTNYDKVTIEVYTNGIITPEGALVEASKIYRKHLNPFVQYFEIGRELQVDEKEEAEKRKSEEGRSALKQKLAMPISELDLSVRAMNCLKLEKIQTIKELVSQNEIELMKVRNFGKTSLKEVKKKLIDAGLSLGMDLQSIFNSGDVNK